MKVACVIAVALLAVACVVADDVEDNSAACYWGDKAGCKTDTGCSYGCHKRLCWSQCNGICAVKVVMEKLIEEGGNIEDFGDFMRIFLADGKNCVKCPEWCYINDGNKGYQSCRTNSECENFGASKCLSHCAMI